MKIKSLNIIAIVLIFIAVYFGDKLIPATSKWNMLMTVIEKGSIYALVAVSMNLLNGFTGLFSLGQAGFMLIGAYVYAVFAIPQAARLSVYQYFNGGLIQFSLPDAIMNLMGGEGTFGGVIGSYMGILILIVAAGLAAGVFAYLIGIPVLRLKSDYLAIATLGFAEILRAFFQWNTLGPITNGSNILRQYTTYSSAVFPVAVSAFFIFLVIRLLNSSTGRAFKAIRDDEIAAEAMGINLFKYKETAFVLSSFLAGVGGALLAMLQGAVNAAPFTSNMTYELLLIVVIGGIGSVTGSVMGSFLFVAFSEWWLRGLDSGRFLFIEASFMRAGFRKVVFAVMIMLIVLFYSDGIMGMREFSWKGLIDWIKSPKKFGNKNKKINSYENNKIPANEVFEPLEMPDGIVVFNEKGGA